MGDKRKLEEQRTVLFYPEVIEAIEETIQEERDGRYASFNHFVRVAVIKLLREEGKEVK